MQPTPGHAEDVLHVLEQPLHPGESGLEVRVVAERVAAETEGAQLQGEEERVGAHAGDVVHRSRRVWLVGQRVGEGRVDGGAEGIDQVGHGVLGCRTGGGGRGREKARGKEVELMSAQFESESGRVEHVP